MYRASPLDELTQRLLAAERVLRERRRLEQQLGHVAAERVELAARVAELDERQRDELHDVDALMSGGLRAWILELLGKLEERMSREQQEYVAAAMEWENAKTQLEALDADAARLRADVEASRDADRARRDVVREFSEFLRQHPELRSVVDPKLRELFERDEVSEAAFHRASRLGKRLTKDIAEALDAGQRARRALLDLDAALHLRDGDVPLESLADLVDLVSAAHSALIRFSREVLDVYVLYPDAAEFGNAVLVSLHFVHDQPFRVRVGDARRLTRDWLIKLEAYMDELRELPAE